MIGILKKSGPINLDGVWVPAIVLLLVLHQVLEDFGPQAEGNRVRYVDEVSVAHLSNYLFVIQLVEAL